MTVKVASIAIVPMRPRPLESDRAWAVARCWMMSDSGIDLVGIGGLSRHVSSTRCCSWCLNIYIQDSNA